MSILLKGVEMPTSCLPGKCPISGVFCGWWKEEHWKSPDEPFHKRHPNCPLVPVPPHGRLIDADALMVEFEKAQRTMEKYGQEYSCSFLSSSQEISTEWYCVEDILDNAPTVIPADPAEKDE